MKLKGHTAIVTGAAFGLGRATAEILYAGGANVVLVDVQATDFLAAALGPRAVAVRADVRDAQQVQAAVTAAKEQFGSVHIAVNCAGVPSSMKIVTNGVAHDLELWRRIIDVNLTGTFNVMRLVAAQMVQNEPDDETGERGVIINTASVASSHGQRGQAAYAASKAGVVGLSLPVARDLCDQAVRCVAIAPGLFETEMVQQVSEKAVAALEEALLFPERMGRPVEYASLVRHIVENPYINATCVRIDGGSVFSARRSSKGKIAAGGVGPGEELCSKSRGEEEPLQ
ncbi:MAG: oxidoreductase [Rhodanobacteraceae bacterium]